MLTPNQKRQIDDSISVITNDFANDINRDVLNGNDALIEDKKKHYVVLLLPLYYSLYSGAMNAQNSFTYRQQITKMIENDLNDIVEHIFSLRQEALNTLNKMNIDVNTYLNTYNQSDSIIDSLSISNVGGTVALFALSPLLFSQSLSNKIMQAEAKANYTAGVNSLDYRGNELYNVKTWSWTPNERTRHMQMDETTIPIDEDFVVINDKTGDMEYAPYPRHESLSPSNSANCLCDCIFEYNPKFL